MDKDPSPVILKQDGAPCHCSLESLAILYANVSLVITRKSVDPELAWPPYSPVLNLCDAFLGLPQGQALY